MTKRRETPILFGGSIICLMVNGRPFTRESAGPFSAGRRNMLRPRVDDSGVYYKLFDHHQNRTFTIRVSGRGKRRSVTTTVERAA